MTPRRMPRASRGGGCRRNGQALVELALILPVVFLMLIGVFDFSRGFTYALTLNRAAFQGAREASNPARSVAQVRAAVRADVPPGVSLNDADISITPAIRRSGDTVVVTAAWSYTPLFPASGQFLPSGVPIQGRGATIVR